MDSAKRNAVKQNVIKRTLLQNTLVGGGGVLFCAVLIAFFVPLGAVIAPSVASDASAAAFRSLWKAARFTVMQAFLSAAGASGIGLCAAFFCARRKFFGRKLLLSLSAIPLSVPPVVIALAFILFFGINGFVNKLLAVVSAGQLSLGTFLYSTGCIVLVHT